MKKHYSRYTLKNVSDITGVSEENLLKVYKQFSATGKPDKAGTILYALGWTQHTVGVQNIRCKLYPGARHELLVETNRQEVFADIAAWLNDQLR